MKVFFSLGFAGIFLIFAAAAHAGALRGMVTVQGKPDSRYVVVYLDGLRGDFPVPKNPPEINHINLRFEPPVLAVLKGATVLFPNSDPVFHSAYSTSPSNPFDLGIYAEGQKRSVQFKNPGVVEVFCHIHKHMHATILVLENPYFAVTDQKGNYLIEDIPEGDYTVVAWRSPSVKTEQKVSIKQSNIVVLVLTLGR